MQLHERSLLLIGHPGHELRLYGWLARARPLVCILTDGSGSDDVPRLDATLEILRDLAVPVGPICGEFSDRNIYAHLLAQSGDVFAELCDRVTDLLVGQRIDTIVSDGIEGYNPTHDLCHAIAAASVRAARRRGANPSHLCIPLIGGPGEFADGASPLVREIALDAALHARKMTAVHDYAARSGATLQREVAEIVREHGEDAFAHEYLFDAESPTWPEWVARFAADKPYYETYGRAQVAAGRYEFLISFDDHVRPVVDRLQAGVRAASPA